MQSRVSALQEELSKETDAKKGLESQNIDLQIKIRDLNDYILELEDTLKKEMQLKNKKREAAAKRKKMKQKREVSMSLSLEKASRKPTRSVNPDDPYMVKVVRHTKVEDLEKMISLKSARVSLGVDERGSINTLAAQRRKKLSLAKNVHSCATASVASQGLSEFSFHPEINRNSKWKPKYDDHHNREKMLERMHDESSKIQAKLRLMSQEKQRQELKECTFTPKLLTKKKNEPSGKPQDISALSERMYEYADKFKKNKEAKKQQLYENSSSFTPKVNKAKNSLVKRKDGQVHDHLYNDFSARKQKLQQLKYNESYGKPATLLLDSK